MTRRREPAIRARWWTAAWTLVVLGLTLRPSPGTLTTPGLCLLCGERGLADAILNVALFFPLGWGARLSGLGLWLICGLGAALSGLIEAIQFFTPGRDASLGDLLFNGAGAALGALSGPHLLRLARPGVERGRLLALGWALALSAILFATAWLLDPQMPRSGLVLDPEPPAPEGGTYEGVVLEQRLAGRPLESGAPVRWPASEGADLLEVRYTLAETRWAFRPFVGIRDGDEERWPVLFGPKDRDLVLRIDRPGGRARLTLPDLVLRDAFAGASAGDTLEARAWREGEAFCLEAAGHRACGLGFSAGSGWALLAPEGWADGSRDRWLDACWLALLAFPLGVWSRRSRTGVIAFGIPLAAAALVPALTALLGALPWTLGGLTGGWASGRMTAGWMGRAEEPRA